MIFCSSACSLLGFSRIASGIAIFPISCRNAPRAITGICCAGMPAPRASAMVKAVTLFEWPSVSASFRSSASPSASSVMSYDRSRSAIAWCSIPVRALTISSRSCRYMAFCCTSRRYSTARLTVASS